MSTLEAFGGRGKNRVPNDGRAVKGQTDSGSTKWSHDGPLDVHGQELTGW